VNTRLPVVDFYVTCATVIPVLFLAVAVEGRTFESLVTTPRSRRIPLDATARTKFLVLLFGGPLLPSTSLRLG
jgi:hypothetical protein